MRKAKSNPEVEEVKSTADADIAELKHAFKGLLMTLDDAPAVDIDVIPTGSLMLDAALGVGGLPRGRVVEMFGPEMSGKSTIAMHVISQAQKMGGLVAYIDAEHALDPAYAAKIGVDISKMLFCQPDSAEEALQLVDDLIKTGKLHAIVVDSVAALTPRAELEGEVGSSQMGLQARLIGQALRKFTAKAAASKTTVIFINQLREKIGVMFGNPETTPGGKALRFFASIRMDVRKREAIKLGDKVIGSVTRVKIVKNKVAPPFTEAELTIIYGKGISKFADLFVAGLAHGVLTSSANRYKFGNFELGHGKEAAIKAIKDDSTTAIALEHEIRAKIAERHHLFMNDDSDESSSNEGGETES